MFILYDVNMNEIPYPDGIVPLDIFVGSIAKERQTETIEGRNGVVDYGFNYRDRPVDLSLWIKAHDTTDYRLLRNELYALFDTGSIFYVAEKNVPSRVLKVGVDDSYIPERLTRYVGNVDISCRTLDSVFWESTYTTLELHDSGYSADTEKYGLVDGIDIEKVQYRFTENEFTVYNAGNVTIEPESMMLNILATGVTGDNLTIRNETTNEEFQLNKSLSGRNISVNGMIVLDGTIQTFRDTNKRFISLAPGYNQISISGAIFNRINFNFKYLYK